MSLGDLFVLTMVVPILVGLQLVVPAAMRRAVFDTTASESFLTVVAASYLHLSVEHLLANVGFYVSFVVVGYLLARRVDAERWFGLAVVTCFVVTPAVTTVTVVHAASLIGAHPRSVVVGFSGVASAVVGVFFVAWLLIFVRRYRGRTAFLLGWLGLSVLLAYVLVVTRPGLAVVERTVVLSFVLFPVVALLGHRAHRWAVSARTTGRTWLRREWLSDAWIRRGGLSETSLLFGGYLASVLVLALALFPADLFEGSGLSLLVHGVGFLVGVGVGVVAVVMLEWR